MMQLRNPPEITLLVVVAESHTHFQNCYLVGSHPKARNRDGFLRASSLYIISVYGKNHIFAKYFFVFHLPGTESTLPSTLLANMAGFTDEKLPSIFNFAKTTQSRLLETIRLNS